MHSRFEGHDAVLQWSSDAMFARGRVCIAANADMHIVRMWVYTTATEEGGARAGAPTPLGRVENAGFSWMFRVCSAHFSRDDDGGLVWGRRERGAPARTGAGEHTARV